jgi:hypothetical protein
MPDDGNLRRNPNTSMWETSFKGEWYPLSAFWDTADATMLTSALSLMNIERVVGTDEDNWIFVTGTNWNAPVGMQGREQFLSLNELMRGASESYEQGAVPTHNLKGDLSEYYDQFGVTEESLALRNRFGQITTDADGNIVKDPKKMADFIRSVAAFEGLSGVQTYKLGGGRQITVIGDKHYETGTGDSGQFSAKTIEGSGYIGITLPDGSFQIKEAGTKQAQDFSLLAENADGDVDASLRGGAPGAVEGEGLIPDAVIKDIVPGYDAVKTARGQYKLVEKDGGASIAIGEAIPLPDGRISVKVAPGKFETLTPAEGAWFVDDWGNAYMRDASGNVQPVTAPTIEEQINLALIQGEAGKAMALADFRDRPSAEERFRLAMEFARSPGDLMTISAIVRGLIEPAAPIEGQVTRVAEPVPWVVSAWNDLTKAWGIPDELKNVLPGISKDLEYPGLEAAFTAGDMTEYNQAVRNAQTKRDTDSATLAGKEAETVETGIKTVKTSIEGAYDPLKATQMAFAGQDLGQEFRNLSADDRFAFDDLVSATGPDLSTLEGQRAFFQGLTPTPTPSRAPGVEFGGQRYGTPFAASLAAQDAAPAPIAPDLNQAQADAFEDAFQQLIDDAIANDVLGLGRPYNSSEIEQLRFDIRDNHQWTDPVTGEAKTGFVDYWNALTDMMAKGSNDPASKYYGMDAWARTEEAKYEAAQDRRTSIQEGFEPVTEPLTAAESVARAIELYPGKAAGAPIEAADDFMQSQRIEDIEWKPPAAGETGVGWRAGGAPREPTRQEMQAQEAAAAAQRAAVAADLARQMDPATLARAVARQREQQQRQQAREEQGEEEDDLGFVPYVPPKKEEKKTAIVTPVITPFEREYDPFDDSWADGGPVFRDTLALVGEEGPELVNLPEGAEVIPADFTEAMLQGRRPRRMQNGGFVQIGGDKGDIIRESDLEALRRGASLLPPGESEKERQKEIQKLQETTTQFHPMQDGQYIEKRPQPRGMVTPPKPSPYPAGVQQVMAGRPIEQPRSLFRPAGLRVPSAQAMRNLVPEEMEAYRELGTLAGIPKGAYEREFREAMPGGQARVRRPRFQARRQRRL